MAFVSWVAHSQTVNDGLMMPKNTVCTGFIYTTDQWTNYWEGTLKRDNNNIGTITTQTLTFVANYGISKKLNLIAMLPYVTTEASKGVLSGMKGIQDLSLTAKYNFFKKPIGTSTLKTFGVLSLSAPMTDYTPDFLPLSIGLHSKNISYRLTANYNFNMGLYINASGAYTWRSNVKLDRSMYFTDGEIFMSDKVKMSNVFDFIVNVGYHKGPLQVDGYITNQNTLGGGDIRRQDMPFVSNKMNFTKLGGFVMYYLPVIKGLAVRGGATMTTAGRNVGQSTTVMCGLLYTIKFSTSNESSDETK